MEQQLQQTRKCKSPRNKLREGKGDYYDNETHVEITKYLCDHGNKAAASKFSAELGRVVTESTVCNMKKTYLFSAKKGRSKACRMQLGGDRCSYKAMTWM